MNNDDFFNLEQQPIEQINNSKIQQPIIQSSHQTNIGLVKQNKKGLGLIIGLVVLLIIVGIACYYFLFLNNPVNVYRNIIKTGINEVYDSLFSNDKKINTTIGLDVDLDLEQPLLEKNILDFINKTNINLNYQIDKDKKQIVVKLDSDYDNESLADFEIYIDAKNQEAYFSAKDYFNKYLKNDIEANNVLDVLFEDNGQIIYPARVKNILIDELISVIKKEYVFKEAGAYVLKITEKELINELKIVLTHLRDKQEFLDCFKNPSEIQEGLNKLINDCDNIKDSDNELMISVETNLLMNKITRLEIKYLEVDFIADTVNNNIEYKLVSNNETIMYGTIKVDNKKVNASVNLDVSGLGKAVINFYVISSFGKEVDKIDKSNAIKIEDLTDVEQTEIMNKFEESKLYEIVSALFDIFGEGNDDFDSEPLLPIDGVYTLVTYDDISKIDIDTPKGFEMVLYGNKILSFEKNNYNVSYNIRYCDSIDDCLEIVDSYKDYMEQIKSYKNIKISNEESITLNTITYYYKDYSYDFFDISYYSKYLYFLISNNNYLEVAITSENSVVSESELNNILSVIKK